MTRLSPRDSRGIGFAELGLHVRRAPLILVALALGSCSPDFHDDLGPRVPIPNVSGEAERDGAAAPQLDVSVRDPLDGHSVASTRTNGDGRYAIVAPSGTWEIKIKGALAGDFESVTRGFAVDGSGEIVAMEPLDIDAYGAAPEEPPDGETLALPDSADSVTFRWRSPSRSFSTGRAQLFDSTGAAVWYSPKGLAVSATWDGKGNQAPFAGTALPPATYTWRVKFDFADSSQARTRSSRVTFR